MSYDEELGEHIKAFEEIRSKEMEHQTRLEIANKKFQEFMRKWGYPENFTMPELLKLAREKGK